jgi:sec-independent protein translocase protein TatA
MFGNIGFWEILLILLVVLLLFGARKLPELGNSLGKAIHNFRSSMKEGEKTSEPPKNSGGQPPAAS